MDINELLQSTEFIIDGSELNILSTNSILNEESNIKI